jgi:hypothetical protein
MMNNPELRWRALLGRRVEVAADAGPVPISVTMHFDRAGDIVRASSQARPFRRDDTWQPTPWAGEYADYREFGGMRMPSRAEVSWELPEGRYVLWRGQVTSALALETPFERRT